MDGELRMVGETWDGERVMVGTSSLPYGPLRNNKKLGKYLSQASSSPTSGKFAVVKKLINGSKRPLKEILTQLNVTFKNNFNVRLS